MVTLGDTDLRQLLQRLLESYVDAFVFFDLKGKILQSNQSFKRLHGTTIHHLAKNPSFPWKTEPFQSALKKVQEGERIVEFMLDFLHTLSGVQDEHGNLVAYSLVIRNRTDDLKFLQTPKTAQHLQKTKIGIALIHGQRILDNNSSMQDIFGYSLTEIRSMDVLELIDEEDRSILAEHIQECHNPTQSTKYLQLKGVRKDGTIIQLNCSLNSTIHNGKPELVCTFFDVTDLNRTLYMLEESDKRYQRLIKLSPDPILIHQNGTLVYVNDAGLQLIGANDKYEILGSSLLDFIHRDDHQLVKKRIRQVTQTDKRLEYVPIRLIRLDGQTVDVESTDIYIYKNMGKPLIQSAYRDLSERKKAESELRRSEKLNIIGQLAAGVAHEIRNPLTSLKGFAQLIKEKDDSQYRQYAEIMLEELDRINLIVNEFMMLAKPDKIQHEKHDFRKLIQDVITLINTQAIMNNISIQSDISLSLHTVFCNANQLKQVFLNLIKNAIEAMPDGGTIRIVVRQKNRKNLLVHIIDEGEGIPEQVLDQLGQPFITTKKNGTGLGLLVSYNIIESHRGEIQFINQPQGGTKVTINLPILSHG